LILYFVRARHAYTMRGYLASFGRRLARRIAVVPYESLADRRDLPVASAIFSDLERLEPGELAAVERLSRRLAEAGARCLNHPGATLRRYDLLRALAERGANHFDVYRAAEAPHPRRFPVFVREEGGHTGSLTPLLGSPAELDLALAKIGAARPLAGLLVVEFCDTADRDGIFRKYSAAVVGERIVPRHLFFGRTWMLKEAELLAPDLLAEERRYVEENPHEAALRELCRFARVDFGRVDYAVRDGALEVFEINTNPTLLGLAPPFDPAAAARVAIHERFAERLSAALEAIDSPRRGRVPLPPLPELPAEPRGPWIRRLRAAAGAARRELVAAVTRARYRRFLRSLPPAPGRPPS
jgi:hypothetical protein